ncbi:serine protease P38 precursor [Tribolium castaneum]|uniref:Serine protease P38 n=1 Tax=Tribolium castaneum TaxID=7070 RepID=D6WDH9_TRICA|nr:serine protease P38 precursor [Tribolium castaneum]EFA01275.1 serine protease P38 [Tribolium castaneum]|eukprot:NP_001164240.1 serine protease P38 precursor [Tribolium castaneum]
MARQAIFLAILAWGHCGATNLKRIQAHVAPSKLHIIGGDEVVPHSVPYQVGLKINGNAFCGGALISPNYVLTAAHCGKVIRSVDVILGAHNISNPSEDTQVTIAGSKIINHENYNSGNYRNDICLIQLSQPAPINDNIQVAKLPPSSDLDKSYFDETVTATGWGLIKDVPFPTTKDMSDVLTKVDVKVSNITECGMYYNDDEDTYVVDTNLCTSGYRNKGTCNGDSGGPLSLDGVLIGVTSFGTLLCEMCSPSVYTKVVNYLDWIAANSDVKTF